MRTSVHRGARVLLVLVLAVFGLTCVGGAASAATVAIELCAVPGTATLPGGGTVPDLGLRYADDPRQLRDGDARACPDRCSRSTRATWSRSPSRTPCPPDMWCRSRFPGSTFDPGPTDAAPGGAVTRTFTAPAGHLPVPERRGRRPAGGDGPVRRVARAHGHCQPGLRFRDDGVRRRGRAGPDGGRSGVQRRAGDLRPAELQSDVLARQRERVPGDPGDHSRRRVSGCCCATSTPATTTPR